eukprot:CAMPEP_0114607786 /NCGR_PEP_ID=MMETSP0168-20121206/2243_1 /TAXON_ID=95228 ORGANISM="Vannella sp., Strain DIVA3 517/6/12" /NCGR_SAMPLE_ID=MMETSP0168 /ASSEMBLY_ACC=CAM_ASM_000044 /LENGTH=181 /DNA_ID=CAMNT_0001818665 /DNA_START=210 /DNA_END=755 /DNA_ORIENTATION=+
MTAGIEITSEFSWVIAVACSIGLQVVLQGFAIGGQRRRLFNKEFFKKNFPKMNESDYPKGGYPDMGSGIFAQKLSYEDWVTFNNYQRAHYNYVEGAATAITAVLGCGVFNPRLAVTAGLTYIVGRSLYALGYRAKGAKGRTAGVLLVDVALLTMVGYTLYQGFTVGGGVAGFVNLMKGWTA